MPEIIEREDGTKVEVFSREEISAKEAELEAARKLAAEKEEELKKFNDKDFNFKALREQKEASDKKVTELENSLNDFKNSFVNERVEDQIKRLSNGDDELAKKIRLQFDRLPEKPVTAEDVGKKVLDAYKLASEFRPSSGVHIPVSSAGSAPVINTTGKAPVSDAVREVAAKMGMTPEEVEKYDARSGVK